MLIKGKLLAMIGINGRKSRVNNSAQADTRSNGIPSKAVLPLAAMFTSAIEACHNDKVPRSRRKLMQLMLDIPEKFFSYQALKELIRLLKLTAFLPLVMVRLYPSP